MNILFIAHENALNGANKSMLNLIDELSGEHNFFVWCRQGNHGKLIDELNKRKIDYFTEPFYCWCTYKPNGKGGLLRRKVRWYLIEYPHNVVISKKIGAFIYEHNINLIHMNSSIINIGILLKSRYNLPLIWHIREFGKEDFGWVPLCSDESFYQTINTNADKVIAISKAVASKFEDKIDLDKLEVVYNGIPVDSQISNRIYLEDPNRNLVFLDTGVLSEAKGQKIAINAMKILKDRGYTNVTLLLAGKGNIEDICTSLDEKELNIYFLGQVDDMNTVRKNTDVELVCSKCEAFGRVTIEAMMSGMPVIGANSGGTPELIKNGITGFVFNTGDSIDLANNMIRFIEDRSLVKKMGMAASRYAKDKFNMKRCANGINKIYKEVIN